ncbi:hypothetical protein FVE85_2182 [Porphyridium purpureum]|uniref:Uncharacterized protein n=1 Tax=Porphyridium purpureum TaxID=35688 RepID=A0A5J4YZZ9_PORPP|nr:hypothetical protein FVE85_2182 [Porphyridium purpureum]|eukprot:POR0266..scf209_3
MMFVNVGLARPCDAWAHGRSAACAQKRGFSQSAVGTPAVARRASRRAVAMLAGEDDSSSAELKPPPTLKAKPQARPLEQMEKDTEELVEAFGSRPDSALVRPRDPSELRTESERRRNSPVKPVRSIRKRRRLKSDELDWDALDSQPLVRRPVDPATGEDYYIEIDMEKTREPRKKRRPRPVDANMREKLKRETISPYKNNWIGVIVVVVLVLINTRGTIDAIFYIFLSIEVLSRNWFTELGTRLAMCASGTPFALRSKHERTRACLRYDCGNEY